MEKDHKVNNDIFDNSEWTELDVDFYNKNNKDVVKSFIEKEKTHGNCMIIQSYKENATDYLIKDKYGCFNILRYDKELDMFGWKYALGVSWYKICKNVNYTVENSEVF